MGALAPGDRSVAPLSFLLPMAEKSAPYNYHPPPATAGTSQRD